MIFKLQDTNSQVKAFLKNQRSQKLQKRTTNIAAFEKFIDKKNDAHITKYVVNEVFNKFEKDLIKLFKNNGYVVSKVGIDKKVDIPAPIEVKAQQVVNQ